nr:DUF418 domain-containing protein [Kibdelosporangium phytohabitans]
MPGERSLYATSAVGITFMVGVALLLLGGFLMPADRPRWQRALWPLAAAGGMAMTWYAGHFVYLKVIGNPHAFSSTHFLAVVAVTLTVSVLWRRWLQRGPLEWLVHKTIVTFVPGRRRTAAA